MGFFNDVFEITKKIPIGRVATYGQIARLLGQPRKSKFVGWALHKNPQPGIIPCHRVVNIKGELSGSFAFGGFDEQKRLLELEKVYLTNEGKVDLAIYGWKSE